MIHKYVTRREHKAKGGLVFPAGSSCLATRSPDSTVLILSFGPDQYVELDGRINYLADIEHAHRDPPGLWSIYAVEDMNVLHAIDAAIDEIKTVEVTNGDSNRWADDGGR